MIDNNQDIKAFNEKFLNNFDSLNDYLKTQFIDNMESLNIAQEENVIANEIFKRLSNFPIIDKYKAYQILDDKWQGISTDLEIIQTEGFSAIKQVDPNMVVKRKMEKMKKFKKDMLGTLFHLNWCKGYY